MRACTSGGGQTRLCTRSNRPSRCCAGNLDRTFKGSPSPQHIMPTTMTPVHVHWRKKTEPGATERARGSGWFLKQRDVSWETLSCCVRGRIHAHERTGGTKREGGGDKSRAQLTGRSSARRRRSSARALLVYPLDAARPVAAAGAAVAAAATSPERLTLTHAKEPADLSPSPGGPAGPRIDSSTGMLALGACSSPASGPLPTFVGDAIVFGDAGAPTRVRGQ